MTAVLLAVAGSEAAGQAPPPASATPPGAPPPPENFVVVSRIDRTQAVESADLRLILTKGKREERALVRWLIFVTVALRTTEPIPPDEPEPASDAAPAAEAPAAEADLPQTCRWDYQAFLQRQICFSSITGLLSCTNQEIATLPEQSHGDAPLPKGSAAGTCTDTFRPALSARTRMTSDLIGRAKEIFAADQRAKVAPLFRAAGVEVRNEEGSTPPAAASAPRRAS